jgi:hypothetical protein
VSEIVVFDCDAVLAQSGDGTFEVDGVPEDDGSNGHAVILAYGRLLGTHPVFRTIIGTEKYPSVPRNGTSENYRSLADLWGPKSRRHIIALT